jgi:hypothetical protein
MGKSTARVAEKTIKDKGMMKMFNGMLGDGNINIPIAYKKFIDIKNTAVSTIQIVEKLTTHPFFSKTTKYKQRVQALEKFVQDSNEIIATDMVDNLEKYPTPDSATEQEKDIFKEMYSKMKKLEFLRNLILTCRNLARDKSKLEEKRYSFIENMAGNEYKPLSFCEWNLKEIFIDTSIPKDVKTYLIMWLYLLYKRTHDIYQYLTSPDIDVDEFVNVVLNSLKQIKKQIPRCDRAFKKIEDSVGLLKENFNSYYRDFISTQNPSIMIENFVIDVSKDAKTDPDTVRQFRKIIMCYRKMAQGRIKDPKVKALFDRASASFDALGGSIKEDEGETKN